MSNRVIAFNVTGKPVKKFLSVSDCARKEGISMSVLRRQIVDGTLNEETGHFYDYELRECDK